MTAPEEPPKRPGRSPARTIGLAVIGLCSVYVAAASTYRIFQETLFPEISHTDYTCRTGTTALYEAVEHARHLAADSARPERAALEAFREHLIPVWEQAPAVRQKCETDGDQEALRAFRTVELLRYAEERAVRYNAIDLTKWRLRAPELVGALGVSTPKK